MLMYLMSNTAKRKAQVWFRPMLDRPHTTRFLSSDGSDRIRYETTGYCRGSWHMTEIGVLVIHHLTLHD